MPEATPSPASTLSGLLGDRDLVLLGCGRMGSALLNGWLAAGINPGSVRIHEPAPSDALRELVAATELTLNPDLPPNDGAVSVIAVKPQVIDAALAAVAPVAGAGGLCLSIAAGITISRLAASLPGGRVIRCMPNTPAEIGRGITALAAGPGLTETDRQIATGLMAAVGEAVWFEDESDLDAVTAVSGSGPAYVFHLIECLAAAGEAEGLAPELSLALARATIDGAGALAMTSEKSPTQLRAEVTSSGGTTAEGLKELAHPETGLGPLMKRTVAAATRRSRELAES